jgi:hypothetical protein
MLHFILNQIFFYISLLIALFLPGYFFLLATFGKGGKLSCLERLIVSSGLSLIIVDFLMLFLNRVKVPITRFSILVSIAIFILICCAIYKIFRKNSKQTEDKLFVFSPKKLLLVALLIFLTFFIKATYLKDNVLPSTTDLGHHLYWSKVISETGQIPNYTMRDINQSADPYSVSQPKPISDFIIGEHLIFSAINLLSGVEYISYFPVVTLLLINILSILALFILALRLFEDFTQSQNIAILTLFFAGPIFAVAPPQAKYVGGGVIGNVLGNLLIPLIFYFFFRALKEKDKWMLFLALIFSMGIFYTHHLSGLLFLLAFVIIFIGILIIHFKEIGNFLKVWSKIIFSPLIISFLIFAAVFALMVYTPTYLTNRAVDTVVGGPTKIDHTGLTLGSFEFTVGEPKAALGIIGLLIFAILSLRIIRKKSYAELFLFAWVFFIMLISIKPTWSGLDIPSARVANYGAYPFALLAAFAISELIAYLKDGDTKKYFLNHGLWASSAIILATFIFASGFFDNSQYATRSSDAQKTIQTFAAAQYLSRKSNPTDQIVTDHIYIASDSFIKHFFMRDYNFPYYRANLTRYANNIDKQESCTLEMISTPDSTDSQKCYQDLGIDFTLINKKFDGAQFDKLANFSQVYTSSELNIYYRK